VVSEYSDRWPCQDGGYVTFHCEEDEAIRATIADGSLAFKGCVAVLTIAHQMYASYSIVITGS
jgi:hypothetical protein